MELNLGDLKNRISCVAFDWDGTAVVDRRAGAGQVRDLINQLCEKGFDLVIITGTNIGNIDPQLNCRPIGPGGLYACTNRGSEVYSIGEQGPVLIQRRNATEDENRMMDAAAQLLVKKLEDKGLHATIIYDRLNRRKIDLIPLPEWADPPKERIGELQDEVLKRTHGAGFGSLSDVILLGYESCSEVGLTEARITSDVKHIEVGLTDKSDSMRWVYDNILERKGRSAGELLIIGDEFGPIGESLGSDFHLLSLQVAQAQALSVGKEPNGVPPGVVHVGGGPATFVDILRRLVSQSPASAGDEVLRPSRA